jgi:hypothetical protein
MNNATNGTIKLPNPSNKNDSKFTALRYELFSLGGVLGHCCLDGLDVGSDNL